MRWFVSILSRSIGWHDHMHGPACETRSFSDLHAINQPGVIAIGDDLVVTEIRLLDH